MLKKFNKIGLPLTKVQYIMYIHRHNWYVHIKHENDSIMCEMTALCIHVTDGHSWGGTVSLREGKTHYSCHPAFRISFLQS